MGLRGDRRALGLGTLGFFAILTVSALLFILMNPALTDIFAMVLGQTNNQQATDVIEMQRTIWGLILFFPLLLAAIFIIARSVREASP
jgi:hypothetical protein